MQKLIEDYFAKSSAVGAAVCWIEHGKAELFVHGKKSIQGNEPITVDTLFEVGSITKLFTTLLLADMVKKAEVQLSDPIEKYLPNVRVPQLEGYKITLGHLATHTSGLPQLPDNFKPANPNNQYADYTVDKLYEFLNNHHLRKIPGKHLVYSNMGIGLLGHILSRKTGKSYEELVFNFVTEHLEMHDTCITLTPEKEKQLSAGHSQGGLIERVDMGALPGEGALRSHIKDMGKFLAANMGLVAEPLKDLFKACHQQMYKADQLTVGLGWIILNGILMHSGGTGGFRSFIGFNPKTEKGVVILSNCREAWVDDLGKSLLDPDFKAPQINQELADDPDYLKHFVGAYDVNFPSGSPTQELQISIMDKHLVVLFKNGSTGMLYPERFSIFGIRGFPEGKVRFSFDSSGQVITAQALHTDEKVLWEAIPKLKRT
jgi:serine-type D-Ala-D-Ala carboxypeptidase/endopeptidase